MKYSPMLLGTALLLVVKGVDVFSAENVFSIDLPTELTDTSEYDAPQEVTTEADMEAIEAVWRGLKEALRTNDLQLVGQYFTEASRKRYVTLYSYLGPEMVRVPSTWSEFTAIEMLDNIAVYAFIQSEPAGDRMYRAVFVRDPKLGWLIQEM